MSSDDLLTSLQAGALIGKSARTVVRLADAGSLPYAQKLPGPNGAYLFDRSDIAAWLASKKPAASQGAA